MTAPPRYAPYPRHVSPQSFSDDDLWEVSASDRVGPPLVDHRRRKIVMAVLLLTIGGKGAWTWLQDPAGWKDWVTTQSALLAPALERSLSAASKRDQAGSPANQPQAPTTAPSAGTQEAQAPSAPPPAQIASAIAPAEPVESGPPQAIDDPEDAPQPLPPPPAPTNPLEARALAAGLHPGISRVVLGKLTPADFENASAAIRKALAEVADDGTLVWPAQRQPEQALFKVHFVRGAATSDCRRYVVGISKDGWLTTALPMERCGLRPPKGSGKSQRG